jgi:hypothetical protein
MRTCQQQSVLGLEAAQVLHQLALGILQSKKKQKTVGSNIQLQFDSVPPTSSYSLL